MHFPSRNIYYDFTCLVENSPLPGDLTVAWQLLVKLVVMARHETHLHERTYNSIIKDNYCIYKVPSLVTPIHVAHTQAQAHIPAHTD